MQLLGLYRELCPGHTELESMRDHLDAGEYPEKNTLIDSAAQWRKCDCL